MTRTLARLVIGLTLLGAACGGGSDGSTTAPATTPAPATTTLAPTTTAPTAALGDYLSVIYGAMADLVDDQNALATAAGSPDDLAVPWQTLSDRFGALEPPPAATDFHDGWIALSADLIEISEEFAAGAIDQQALNIFLAALSDLGDDIAQLDALQLELALTVLEERTDEVGTFLADVLMLQQLGAPVSEELFGTLSELGTDPDSAIRKIFASAGDLATIRDGWQELVPPAAAADLHGRQVELLSRIISTFTELGAAFEDQVDPRPSLINEMNELGVLSPELNAEWSRFIGEALES